MRLGKLRRSGEVGGGEIARAGSIEIEAETAHGRELRLVSTEVRQRPGSGIAIASPRQAALVGGEPGDERGRIQRGAAGQQGHGLRGADVAGERGELREHGRGGGAREVAVRVRRTGWEFRGDGGVLADEVVAAARDGAAVFANVRGSDAGGVGVPGHEGVRQREGRGR